MVQKEYARNEKATNSFFIKIFFVIIQKKCHISLATLFFSYFNYIFYFAKIVYVTVVVYTVSAQN
jgi:plasmid replication initiation protein